MIGAIISQGRGVVGLHRYLSHDRVVKGEPAPETSERVSFIRTFRSPSDDGLQTVRIMQDVVADRKILKGRHGVSPGGRRLQTAYVHGLISFAPGETPSEDDQVAAVEGWLAALGLDEHVATAYGHRDGGVTHVHTVACRVHPYTGIAAPMSHGKLRLSTWSREWEEGHGGIVIQARQRRAAERAEFRATVDEEVAALPPAAPDEPQPATKRDRAKRRAKERRDAKAKARASGAHPMTPIATGRRAGQDDRTPEEKARWTALYADPDFNALTRREKKTTTTALKADMLAKRQAALEQAPAPPAEQPPTQVPGIAAVAPPVVAAPPVDTETPVVAAPPVETETRGHCRDAGRDAAPRRRRAARRHRDAGRHAGASRAVAARGPRARSVACSPGRARGPRARAAAARGRDRARADELPAPGRYESRDAAARSSTGDPALERSATRRRQETAPRRRHYRSGSGVRCRADRRAPGPRRGRKSSAGGGGGGEDGRRAGRVYRGAHRDRAHPLPGSTGPERPAVPARAANVRHRGRPRRHRPRRPGAGPQPSALATVAHAMMQDQVKVQSMLAMLDCDRHDNGRRAGCGRAWRARSR